MSVPAGVYGNDLEIKLPELRPTVVVLVELFLKHMDEQAKQLGCEPKRLMVAWDTGSGYSLVREEV